jgi:phosphinothricin acetyltransferase
METGALTIRPAVETDLAEIVAIYNAAIPTRTATAQLELVTVEQQTPWFRAHGGRHPIWVACDDDAMAGWLSVTPWSDRTAYDATAEISLYLAPAFQGRGIGARLVRYAIAQAPQLGIDTLIARAFGHNTASLKLFDRFDFQRWGVMRGIAVVDGVRRDVVCLGRRV